MKALSELFWMNRSRVKRLFIVLIFSVFSFVFAYNNIYSIENIGPNQEENTRKKVLFISSYNSDFPTFKDQLKGLSDVFTKEDYQLDLECMDSKRFYSEENMANFKRSLSYKLDNTSPYDVIIAGDDNALQFVMDNQADMFSGIPVVFLGINDRARAEVAHKEYGYTGIVEATSIEDTIRLMTELDNKIKRLVLVVDGTTTGQGELRQVLSYKDYFEGIEFLVEDLSTITYDQLADHLSTYSDNDVILLLAAYKDLKGQKMSFYEYLNWIKKSTDRPIYHLYGFGIGDGLLGGVVVDYYQHGKRAAEIAIRVMEGEKTSAIRPIMDTSINTTMIDYERLSYYGYKTASLPIDTIFINKPVSFFEENKEEVLGIATLVFFLIVVILVLSLSIQKQKKAEAELKESNVELASMYEELMSVNEELEAQEEELRDSYENLEITSRELKESENRYRYVFDLSHHGMWERNTNTNSIYMTSDWYRRLFKEKGHKDVDKMDVNKLLDVFYNQLDNVQLNRLQLLQEELISGRRASYNIVLECCNKGEKTFFIEEKAKAIYDEDGDLTRIIGSHANITALVLYERQLEEFAYQDQLTRMPNRIILEQKMDSYITDRSQEIASGSIMLIDIDNFKFINNTFGHEIGDDLLQKIAERLKEEVDEDYILGRISGDEFVIICNELHEMTLIEAFAGKLIDLFDQRFKLHDRSIYITVSIGIAMYPENGSDLDTLLNRCNSAVYEAKVKGKNRFDFYDTSMNETMESKIYIQNNIRQAIENQVFELYYQPIYNSKKDKIVSFEALIRWKDEIRGFIPPIDFVVVAEKMGLINKLGDWVIETATTFIKGFNEKYDTDLYVSVNVSSLQLLQKDFVEGIKDIIDKLGVNYSNICVELTETALMQSFDHNIEKLLELRKLGIKISLDDFGTGYSSLNYLRRLPVDILKIDKSFIDDITSSSEDRQLTEGIILLAQKMGIYVIAEGIEDEGQLNHLDSFNCDGIQGYYISKPLSQDTSYYFYEQFKGLQKK